MLDMSDVFEHWKSAPPGILLGGPTPIYYKD
jgi:hypothetical protein